MRVRGITRFVETVRKYPMLFLGALFFIWLALYLFYPIPHQREILAPQGEGDRLTFGGITTLSQEFKPHQGLSALEIPLGSAIDSDVSLLLHLRASIDGEDLIVAPLFSFHEGTAHFDFSPLWRVPEKLVWIIEAPHAPPKSFWVYREHDASVFTEGKLYQNRRMLRGNAAFTEVWQHPRFISFFRFESSIVDFADFEYASLFGGVVLVALFFIIRRFAVKEKYIVFVCVALGIMFHVWLGLTTPVIIDEGAYIQDVLQSSKDLLPFRDFLTKGPMYLFFLWLWSFVVPNTVIAWRLFSIIGWACGGYALWMLTLEWKLRTRSRVLAVAAWSLIPTAVALTTPLLLQVISVSMSVFGLLLAARAMKKDSWRLVMWSAVVCTIACLMRITAVIPSGIIFLYYLSSAQPGKRLRYAAIYASTGILLCSVFFGAMALTIGIQKTAVVMNAEAFLISHNRQERIQVVQEKEPLIRALTIESRLFWRTGVLLLVPLLLSPLVFVHRRRLTISVVILCVVFFIGHSVLLTLTDTGFLLPKKFHSTILLTYALFIGIPFVTAIAALLYNDAKQGKKYYVHWRIPVLLFVWLVLTIFAYSKWGRFRQSYLTELLPQIILISSISFDFLFDLWKKIQPKWLSISITTVFVFLSGMSVYQGYVIANRFPHTGTIDQKSLVKITRLLEIHVPKDEIVFTAQPVATAFAQRKILFGYSHPGWYREARFGTISEELRDLLFRKPEEITQYLRTKANFVLYDSRTHEIYFDGYPERASILEKDFIKIDSIVNEMAGDTYTLYRRR